jgi:hypothetical protein
LFAVRRAFSRGLAVESDYCVRRLPSSDDG